MHANQELYIHDVWFIKNINWLMVSFEGSSLVTCRKCLIEDEDELEAAVAVAVPAEPLDDKGS